MIHDGEVLALPLIVYRDTHSAIETLAGVTQAGIAFATDRNQLGVYDGEFWHWLVDATSQVDWVSELSDVSIPTVTAGDVLEYNGNAWVNVPHRNPASKITADSVTLDVGGSGNAVADLQVAHDGNTYDVAEVTATPGIDLKVDFINVVRFGWVNILGHYDGSATHGVSIQLYNWSTTNWDTLHSIPYTVVKGNYDFIVPDDTNYIGTGANVGEVRVRFNHTMAGNSSHDMYLDVVALYV